MKLSILLLWLATLASASAVDFDVAVYGATPGGVMAAVAAGRAGQRVVLLEPSQYLGGALSGGLGMADYGVHASRVLGGQAAEFFQRIAQKYGVPFSFPPDNQCSEHHVPWVSEPHVAEEVLTEMLADANVTVMLDSRVVSVAKTTFVAFADGPSIRSATTARGNDIVAAVYIDGTYEGTLLKLSGVSFTFGREANTTYNESAAGRLPGPAVPHWPHGDRAAQLPRGINPFTDEHNTTLIPGVWGGDVAPVGGADARVGSYDWRLTLTDVPNNSLPIPEPSSYDPSEFEIVRRALAAGWKTSGPSIGVPNRKTDWKAFGLFGERPNAQWEFPNATWERQQEIIREYKQYILRLIRFFKTDSSVPAALQQKVASFGLCRDEFNRSGHFNYQLYVRSALRMVGSRVLTQQDVVTTTWIPDPDTIGLGAYTVDIPGPVQIIVEQGEVVSEGALKVPYFCDPQLAPFALPFQIMLPKKGEVANLIVPVAVSASHIAFNSIRMEPTWMILGQSAGVAAAIFVSEAVSTVRNINVSDLRAKLKEAGQVLEPRKTLN